MTDPTPAPATPAPHVGVGDLVRDAHGRHRVVTDLRGGLPLLRRRTGGAPEEPPVDPHTLTLVARRGSWS